MEAIAARVPKVSYHNGSTTSSDTACWVSIRTGAATLPASPGAHQHSTHIQLKRFLVAASWGCQVYHWSGPIERVGFRVMVTAA